MPTVKFRSYDPRLRPRRTRLEVPGWAGQPEPRADGSHEYPWHCVPFVEAARAGLELCFPYAEELRVSTRDGALTFEDGAGRPLPPGGGGPPFRSFGREYFTYQSCVDLKVDPTHAIKVETHPRFYTDRTGTAPIAVPAVLRAWWPMINFLVFKAPPEGGTHVFRPGEPFVLITVVPAEQAVEVVDMPEAEAAERELQSRRIHASRATLSADSLWTSSTRTIFDGTYRRLSGAARSAAARAKVSDGNGGDGGGGDGGSSPPRRNYDGGDGNSNTAGSTVADKAGSTVDNTAGSKADSIVPDES